MVMRKINTFFALMVLSGAILTSCQQNNPQPNPQPTPQPTYFISAEIDGVNWYAQSGTNGCDVALKPWYLVDNLNDIIEIDYFGGFVQEGFTSQINTTLNGFLNVGFARFTEVHSDYNLNESVFHNSLINVPTSFYQDGDTSPGVELWFYDSTGDWSSRFGTQTSSSFTITSNEEVVGTVFPTRKISGTFSGTLYKENDPQQTKTVTNGSFTLLYEQIQ